MKFHVSLTSVIAAAMLFAVAVAMHEAARADSLVSQGYHSVAQRFVGKNGRKPLGFKGSGGTSRESCTHGENDITVCSNCDSDGVCVVARCVDGRTGLETECPAD